jgi:DNA polymerase-1
MLISYALFGGLDDHEKSSLIEKHLGHQLASLTDVVGKGKAQIGFEAAPVEKAALYSAEHADAALRLWR